MKKAVLFAFLLSLFVPVCAFSADETGVPVDTGMTEPAAEAEPAPAAPEPVAAPAAENLEFVSGEITAMDEAAKTLTVKLYGETEEKSEKMITVEVDDVTDITDGEKDRELKSLAAGTEVDVEYDPATKKATYIFVY